MNGVDRVKAICKERRIPISKLERDLGYANGYIGQLRKGVFPSDRLMEIAEYLSVSHTYILTGEETEKAPAETGRRDETSDRNIIRIAARNGSYQERTLTDEQLAALEAILSQMPDVADDI